MKKVISLLCILIFISCSNQSQQPNEDNIEQEFLEQFFTEAKVDDIVWILATDLLPANETGFYTYFRLRNEKPENLRMRIQYEDHDVYQFNIDNVKYTYKANITKRTGSSFVKGPGSSWYDYEVSRKDYLFLEKVAKSQSTRIVFSDGTNVLLTPEIKSAIQRTLDYFESLGGKLPITDSIE